MSITSEKIDYIIKVGIQPILKREGFKKSSRTFRRSRAGCVQIINIQGSWTNYGDSGQFTINLGVYYPEAAKLHGSFHVTDHPLESNCIVNERIGHLMPVQRDYWWNFDANSDLNKIGQEVVSVCTNYGLPWLDAHSTLAGALQFSLSRKYPFWAAIFSLLLDNRETAKQYLSEAIMEVSQKPSLQSQLEDWGRSKGLVP
ncbi:MAG: DUF4304 domain-containing protein [Anaerolineales bacterium]